jgi:hypothetical protein
MAGTNGHDYPVFNLHVFVIPNGVEESRNVKLNSEARDVSTTLRLAQDEKR